MRVFFSASTKRAIYYDYDICVTIKIHSDKKAEVIHSAPISMELMRELSENKYIRDWKEIRVYDKFEVIHPVLT